MTDESSNSPSISPRTVFIIRAVIISIGFLVLGLGIWLLFLSTRPLPHTQPGATKTNAWFTFLKIFIASAVAGPIITHLQKRFGEERAKKWLVITALVILLFGIVVAFVNVKSTSNQTIPPNTFKLH